MINRVPQSANRPTAITVCSGKGGVGKSTIALILAAKLADTGKRTLLIDASFGRGDISTMLNLNFEVGFEDLLKGDVNLSDTTQKVGPHLWIMGTLPGSLMDIDLLSDTGLRKCHEIDTIFDVIVIDTASTLDPLTMSLVGGSDLAITITTSRIPSIADSYTQLKQAIHSSSKSRHTFLVNRVESETEGEQSVRKFSELVNKFLHYEIISLGILENDSRIEKATENLSLLTLSHQPGGLGRRMDRVVKTLSERYIGKRNSGCSIWEHLGKANPLKNIAAFDDRHLVVHS